MKQCPQCNAWNEDSHRFCDQCGAVLPVNPPGPNQQQWNQQQTNWQGQEGWGNQQPGWNNPSYGYQPPPGGVYPGWGPAPERFRNIALCVVFTIITCGIYGIYWIVKTNDEINSIVGDYTAATGGLVILFTIISCGIYGIYWAYKIGEKVDYIKTGRVESSNILFLVLSIFGLQIINLCFIQEAINRASHF